MLPEVTIGQMLYGFNAQKLFDDNKVKLGGGGGSESTDRRGCAILALEVVPKNLIFA